MLVLGIFAAAAMVEIATVSAFGVGMGDTFTLAGKTASLAWILSVGTFVGTVITNDHTELATTDAYDELMSSSMDSTYAYAVVAAAAVLVGWVLFPQVADFFQSQDLWGVLYIAGISTAQIALGWMY